MNLKIIKLQYTDADSADTEIKYSIVSAILEGGDVILLLPPSDTPAIRKKGFNQIRRIAKEFKELGKITFFATPDNFLRSDTVSKYVLAMFPELEEKLPEITDGCDFLLVRR